MTPTPRVLIVPGLYNSGPAHWQTWLQAQHDGAVRVEQDDWCNADLDRWSRRIAGTVRAFPGATWIAVAHSFGCLALARSLQAHPAAVNAALFVAPADPRKFGVEHRLPLRPLGVPSTLIASENDPWMRTESAGASFLARIPTCALRYDTRHRHRSKLAGLRIHHPGENVRGELVC